VKLKKLSLALTVTLLCLLAMEMLVRIVLPRPGFIPSHPWEVGLLIPHPTRHYAYTPNFVGKVNNREYQIDIVINSLGLRDNPITPNDRVDVLAAGDSFTVGLGVQVEDAWPAQLERYINSALVLPKSMRVVNGGVSGYSLSQIRLLIEELTMSFQPEIVVLGVYSSAYWRLNDPYVYLNGNAVLSSMVPQLRATEGGFLYSDISNKRLERVQWWLMENFHLGAYLLETVRHLEGKLIGPKQNDNKASSSTEEKLIPLLNELEAIKKLLSSRDIGLAVLLVNQQEKDGSFSASEKEDNAIVKSYCRDLGITVFDPVPSFESFSAEGPVFRIGDDRHWSKRAHALVGKELGAFLLQQHWVLNSLLAPK
jgi:hypothetical protein